MRHFVGVLIAVAFSGALALHAEAATLTVVTANDSGPGSLREALANAATSGDTIAFASSLTGATITLTTSDPLSTAATSCPAPFGPTGLVVYGKDVTIDGSGAPGLTIDQRRRRAEDLRRHRARRERLQPADHAGRPAAREPHARARARQGR